MKSPLIFLVIGCILSCCTLSGCSTAKVVGEPSSSFLLDIVDAPRLRRFNIVFSSLDSSALCFATEQWPNGSGEVAQGDQRMSVALEDGKVINGKTAAFSYSCPGGCGYIEVKPGHTLKAFISYDQFVGELPGEGSENKRLNFGVSPRACR